MKKIIFAAFVALCLLGLALHTTDGIVLADGPNSAPSDASNNYCEPGVPCDASLSPARRFELAGPVAAEMESAIVTQEFALPEDSGGPDSFGYTWNDYQTPNWIDATNGTDTGMRGASYNQKVGPIPLGFTFPYYQERYDNLYIAAGGFVSFDSAATVPWQGHVPALSAPNNLIAPYWAPFNLSGKGANGKVFYAVGGTAPNRFLVVEWNKVKGGPKTDAVGGDDTFQFEVILYENGNFTFQYQKMVYTNNYWCGTAGNENQTGMTGFNTLPYCKRARSGKRVDFVRPPAHTRVTPDRLDQGQFGKPGDTVEFSISFRNTGDLGNDTFDLIPDTYWTAELYQGDGVTPFVDTDASGYPDTGPLAVDAPQVAIVKVHIPNDAVVGTQGGVNFRIISRTQNATEADVKLQVAVAPDFTQVFHSYDDHALTLDFIRNSAENSVKVTADNYYPTYPGVVMTTNGNYLTAWNKTRCVDSNCGAVVQEIEYSLRDASGNALTGIRKLKNLGSPSHSKYDYAYGLAPAPNGLVGAVWVEEIDNAEGKWNHNIWFARIDALGGVIGKAKKLTQNTLWGNRGSANVPNYSNARVTVTPNGNYVVVWQSEIGYAGKWTSDIYFEILDSTGKVVTNATKFTDGRPDGGYYSPAAITLQDGTVLLAYTGKGLNSLGAFYGVVAQNGKIIRASTNLSQDGTSYNRWEYYVDAAQLTNGNVVISWIHYIGNVYGSVPYGIRYAVMDSSFNKLGLTSWMSGPGAVLGNGPVSITADTYGNAVFTWHDYNSDWRHNLYYALVPNNGATPAPLVLKHSDTYIATSFAGLGNAK